MDPNSADQEENANDPGYPPGSTINPDGTVTNPSLGITNGQFTGYPNTLPVYNGMKVMPYGVSVIPPDYVSAADVASEALTAARTTAIANGTAREESDPTQYRAANISLMNQVSGSGAQNTINNLSSIAGSLYASVAIPDSGPTPQQLADAQAGGFTYGAWSPKGLSAAGSGSTTGTASDSTSTGVSYGGSVTTSSSSASQNPYSLPTVSNYPTQYK